MVDFIKKIFNKKIKWYEPEDATPREQCPCCDYISLPERNHWLICPICFWEDDGQDLDNVDEISGPNHITLIQGRENFKKFGACDKGVLEHVVDKKERSKYEYKPRKFSNEKSFTKSS